MAEREILYNDKGKRICGATKSNRSGICQSTILYANGRCQKHGGPTPNGANSTKFKHGKHSRYLPPRLIERYGQALEDPNLLELREEVALTDARLGDLLTKIDTGESGAKWKALRRAHTDLLEAIASGDPTDLMAAVRAMGRLIDEGNHDADLWIEIFVTVEQRRKLVESERKRLDQMEQLVTVSEMMALAAALLNSVQSHVADKRALSAISTDFARLISIDGTQTARGS